jgi:hypothetical protein
METTVQPLVSDHRSFVVTLRPEDYATVRRYGDDRPGTDTATVVWLAVVSGIEELRHRNERLETTPANEIQDTKNEQRSTG